MGKPSATQLLEAARAEAKKFPPAKKQMSEANFKSFAESLSASLEKKDLDWDASNSANKLALAKLIHNDAEIKAKLLVSGGKIGTFAVALLAPSTTENLGQPHYHDLDYSVTMDKDEYATIRTEVAKFLGINDKGHSFHEGNSTASQSLRQIILNLCSKVQGPQEIERVKTACKTYYKFDPS